MQTKEISDKFVAPCFINRLEAYDGEINLGVEENMISNDSVVKLCLEYEVKHGYKMVKKELIVALRGEIYFVKFIINPEEDDVEPGVVFGISFLQEKKISDDRDLLLDDLDFGDISDIEGVNVPQFVCRMGDNKEAEREALAISICKRYSPLEEKRPVIKTMTYREALIEKDDPRALVIPIRLEGKINLNALVDTGLDINVIPYHIYKELGREEVQNVKKGISMLNHSKAEPIGLLSNVLYQVGVTTIIAKFLILCMPIDRDTPMLVGRGFLHTYGGILNTIDNITLTFDGICHQTFRAAKKSLDSAESDSDDEEEYAFQRN
nr:hypothetical protein [Tanacetum cinerariifolium]